jgi:hypothetical protein
MSLALALLGALRASLQTRTDLALENLALVPAGFKSLGEGAATSVWCATSRQLEDRGGVYCEDCLHSTPPGEPIAFGQLDFRAKARPPHHSEQGAIFASIPYAKSSGLVRPWSGTKNTKLDPAQKFRARSSYCLVAGAGFEPATFGL